MSCCFVSGPWDVVTHVTCYMRNKSEIIVSTCEHGEGKLMHVQLITSWPMTAAEAMAVWYGFLSCMPVHVAVCICGCLRRFHVLISSIHMPAESQSMDKSLRLAAGMHGSSANRASPLAL